MDQLKLFAKKYELRAVEEIPSYQYLPISEKFCSSLDIHKYLKNAFFKDKAPIQEHFIVLALNRNNTVIGLYQISMGGRSSTIVDAALILKFLIETCASSCVLCHNHPSGNIQPSQSDIDLTKKVNNTLKMVEINLLDHIIYTDDGYFSFVDEGISF